MGAMADEPQQRYSELASFGEELRRDRNVYILVVIVAALIAASWWALKHKRETRAEEARVDTVAAATVAPKPIVAAPAAAPVPEPPPLDDSLKLTIDVTRDSWVTL